MVALTSYGAQSRQGVISGDVRDAAVTDATASGRAGAAASPRSLGSRAVEARPLPGRSLGSRAVEARPLPGRSVPGRGAPAHCDGASPGTLHGSRLTPRGRVVVALVWIVLLGVAALILSRPVGSVNAAGDGSVPTSTVEVRPGDTLWRFASEIRPEADPREVVHAIVVLNDLASPGDIHPGDTLVVPAGD